MKILRTIPLVLLALSIALGCNNNKTGPVSEDKSSGSSKEKSWNEEFMLLINAHRMSEGLRSINDDPALDEIALTHSRNMAKGVVPFGHNGFSSRCSQAYMIMSGGSACGENVAQGQSSPEIVFQSWMNSPGHRANIEKADYTHSGFGYMKDSAGKYYWTHIFIRR